MELKLPRRVRLVKLLRAHGLRHAERLREDELKDALDRINTVVEDERERVSPRLDVLPSSASLPSSAAPVRERATPVVVERPAPPAGYVGVPRFYEAEPTLPTGARTFLRLIAVDPETLFFTWDFSDDDRARIGDQVRLLVHRLDDEHAPAMHTVTVSSGRWTVPAPADRVEVMGEIVDDAGRTVARSNPAIVPAGSVAPAGPLLFATLSPDVDRRGLVGGALLASNSDAGLPAGAAVEREGVARAPDVSERRVSGALPFSRGRARSSSSALPSSGRLAQG